MKEIHDIELWCGDAAELLDQVPGGYFNCLLTSPPFQGLRMGVENYFSDFDFNRIASSAVRVLNPKGGLLIWQIGSEVVKGIRSTVPEENLLAFKQLGLNYHDDIIYQKSSLPFHVVSGTRHTNAFEHCYIMFRGRKPAVVKVLKDRPNRTGGRVDNGVPRPMLSLRTNCWEVACGHNKSTLDHISFENGERFSAVMPEKLADGLIRTFSLPGQRICDPFGGCFTTAKMSILNSRRCLCIERSAETFRLGVRRLETMGLEKYGLKLAVREAGRVGWDYVIGPASSK